MRTLTLVGGSCVPSSAVVAVAADWRRSPTISVPPAPDPCVVNTPLTLTPGSVIDLGGRALQFGPAARVVVGAGDVVIMAGPVQLQPGARISGTGGLAITNFEIDSTGSISLEAMGSTKSRIDLSAEQIAGSVTLSAQAGITVAGDFDRRTRTPPTAAAARSSSSPRRATCWSAARSPSRAARTPTAAAIFIQAPGKVDLSQMVDISGGDFGGGELDIVAGGDAIVRQDVNAAGGGFSGDGGALSIDAARAASPCSGSSTAPPRVTARRAAGPAATSSSPPTGTSR